MGLFTHHADPRVALRLPADGVYRVAVADAQRRGGPESAYRLRVSAPRPDFQVFVTPSSLSVPVGRSVPFRAHVVRRDGFDGPIDLATVEAPAGFSIDGGTIPAGATSARMTLTARDPFDGPFVLRVEATARIGGGDVRHAALPADDRMQAFAYRQLVPAEELMVQVVGGRRAAFAAALADAGRVRLPLGGSARVRVRAAARGFAPEFDFDALSAGVTLDGVTAESDGFSFVLRADAAAAKAGTFENVIVELLAPTGGGRGKAKSPRGASLGFLPAVAVEIVAASAER